MHKLKIILLLLGSFFLNTSYATLGTDVLLGSVTIAPGQTGEISLVREDDARGFLYTFPVTCTITNEDTKSGLSYAAFEFGGYQGNGEYDHPFSIDGQSAYFKKPQQFHSTGAQLQFSNLSSLNRYIAIRNLNQTDRISVNNCVANFADMS